jgi:hypothetical protein
MSGADSTNDPFRTTELLYARRWAGLGELVGGGDERWEISDTNGRAVATVVETDLTMLRRVGRFLNNLFPDQQRRRLEVQDSASRTLFTIIRVPPKLGLEYAEVWMGDGSPAGTIRLIRPDGSDRPGLGFYNPRDERLGEIRHSQESTRATGHSTSAILAADGTKIGRLANTKTRGGGGPDGYRLRISQDLPDPLRSLVYASPVVRYFIQ